MGCLNDWAMRAIRLTDPETAHRLAIRALMLGLAPTLPPPPRTLATQGFGRNLASPLGIAAGLDKGGEAIAPLLRMGASFIEIGAVTPIPQPGNPKPRLCGCSGAIRDRPVESLGSIWALTRIALTH
jgi:dihydroorotate dehydrogenase